MVAAWEGNEDACNSWMILSGNVSRFPMLRGILLSFIQPVGRRVYRDAIKSVISWKLLSLKHLSRYRCLRDFRLPMLGSVVWKLFQIFGAIEVHPF
ncbi:hypothetical protein Tsubulata_019497 [Turnera subulata]|uniref:Uncharacterized protein n=1 Tax=Turnera subulata TaxID=218843 RepID=A0A9Q0F1S9_9ROSI|nr:hypothetical protein Tsubulata_019497 [Turnera subulata]